MTARESDTAKLKAIGEVTKVLLDTVAPFVRWEHPQHRLSLHVSATRPRVPAAEAPVWSAQDGVARVVLRSSAGGEPSTLLLRPGRLAVEDGFVTLRTRIKVEGAAGAAAYANELLDGIFGYVKPAAEPEPDARIDESVLVWERPVNRCEVLLVVQRAFGRELGGEIPFRFVDDRIVLDLTDQEDPRWDTSGGLGVFDPWPFAVWLARRHVRLQRPALRVAIEPGRGRPTPSKPAKARKKPAARRAPARRRSAKR